VIVRTRPSPLWAVRQGDAVLGETLDGWIQLTVNAPGPIVIE
jgi:hypothetical protein